MRSLKRLLLHPEFNFALRQTLIIAIPPLIALPFGDMKLGLLLLMAVICCTVAGLDSPQQNYLRRVTFVTGLFFISSLSVGLLVLLRVPEPLILLLLAFTTGVLREISIQNIRLMPACLAAGILTLTLIKIFPFWQAALIFLIGSLWFGLFTFFWIHLWQFIPLRDSLNKVYIALADYLETKYQILVASDDPEQASLQLLAKQQLLMELLSQSHQLLAQLNAQHWHGGKRMLALYQTALDLQEHITSSLNQPSRVHDEIHRYNANHIIMENIQCMTTRLRTVAKHILYSEPMPLFSMKKPLAGLCEQQQKTPQSEVLTFCTYHFGRISQLLTSLTPLYERDLCGNIPDPPLWQAIRNYLNPEAASLRMALRTGITLAIGALIGSELSLPRSYWIMLTIVLVMQGGYNATKVRIQHRAIGTLLGLVLGTGVLLLNLPVYWLLTFMFVGTLVGYSLLHNHYGWAVVLITVMVVCLLQLLTHDSVAFLIPRMEDTLLGCVLAFLSTMLLWPQWQSHRLLNYADTLLSRVNEHMNRLRALIHDEQLSPGELSLSRVAMNQAQMDLNNAYTQALQEPGYQSKYLKDILLWQSHSQQVIEHMNSMTVEIREKVHISVEQMDQYQNAFSSMIEACRKELSQQASLPLTPEKITLYPQSISTMPLPEDRNQLDHHFYRILSHLQEMYTISSLAIADRNT